MVLILVYLSCRHLKLKAVVIDGNLTVIHQDNVQFDSELPEFR